MRLLTSILLIAFLASCAAIGPKQRKRYPGKPRVVYVQKTKVITKKIQPRVIVVKGDATPKVIVVHQQSSPLSAVNSAQIEVLRAKIRALEGGAVTQTIKTEDKLALEDAIEEHKKKRQIEADEQSHAIDAAIDRQREILASPTPSP